MVNFCQKKTTTKTIFFIAFAVVFLFSSKVNAEVIHSFDSKIKINPDSSILVTETIKYDFENIEKHGIFRDIPVRYKTSVGNKSVELELQSVTIDGQIDDYIISNNGSNKNIKIGKADILITGEHTYVIVYKIKGAINYFENQDELYWNVTGNDWVVPIENVTTSVALPDYVSSRTDLNCYEGVLGSNNKCQINFKDNLSIAMSTQILEAGEGLTIAADFSKGIVYEPTKLENIINLIKDNIILILPLFIFIVMFFIWRKYGKDPKGYSTIIAQYEAPINMKPTLVGSLVDERPDYRDVTAGLIYLAEQGFINIKRLEKEGLFGSVDYEIELIKNDINTLEKTEKSILVLFFEDNLIISSNKKISDFKKNSTFSLKVRKIISELYQEMTDKGYFVSNPTKTKATYMTLAIIPVLLIIFIFSDSLGILGIISVIISGIIILIFGNLMSKKTKLGSEVKDQILGFKKFLSVTEKERLNFHNAPEKNPKQFMEFLPYAIALGVENKWAKQFEGIYIEEPSWYQSNIAGSFMAGNFISQISDFSNSVNTSISYISKGAASGGFGGGGSGFSGGGFGGGGGGSW